VAAIARAENIQLSPDDLRAMIAYIRQHRTAAEPFDVVLGGPPLAAELCARTFVAARPSISGADR
jgi:hypothetical protein